MTEDELITRLRVRNANPKLATSAATWAGNHWIYAQHFPPAPAKAVRDAQEQFGFTIPKLLLRLWSEVANGGVGPGYGIYGLEGGLEHAIGLTLPDLYLTWRDDSTWIDLVGEKPAPKSFPICDWGCCQESVVDCSLPEGNMLLITDKGDCINQQVNFSRWMEDWLDGTNVGAADYKPKAE
jgi:hypothetical protein